MSDTETSYRCQHRAKQRDGTEVECSDVGGWVRDRKLKTWRPAKPSDRKRRCWLHGPGSEVRPIGRNRRDIKPNASLQRYAALVLGLSPEVSKALHEIADELSLLGYPSSSGGATKVVVDDDADDPVGDDASRIHQLTMYREDLRDAIDDLGCRVDGIARLVRQVRRLPPAAMGAKLCAENQQSRQGSIEWGDPTCTELPTKRGLCVACYHRERRWRTDHELPTDERAAG